MKELLFLFLSFTDYLWLLIILVIIFESTALLLRFKFGLKGKDYRPHINGLPMHHSILGLIGVLLAVFIFKNDFLLTVSWALVVSDLIHHLVLCLIKLIKNKNK